MKIVHHIKSLANESLVYGVLGTLAYPRTINLILIPIYTRIFTPDEYGVLMLVTIFLSFCNTLLVFGMDNSAIIWFHDTTKEEEQKATFSTWFWFQFTFSVLAAALLFMTSNYFSNLIFQTTAHSTLIKLVALSLPFFVFDSILSCLLRSQRKAWKATFYSILNAIINVLCVIFLIVVLKKGLVGFFEAKFIAIFLIAIIAIFFLNSWLNIRNFSLQQLKAMLKYATPFVPAAIASFILVSADCYMLKYFHSSAEVGIYSTAFALSSLVAIFTKGFQKAIGPFSFSIQKDNQAKVIYSKILSLFTWISCILCMILLLLMPIIFKFVATEKYESALNCVPFLMFSFLFLGIRDVVAIGSTLKKKSKPIAVSIFISAIVNIILNFLLIPTFEKEGAAFSTLIAYIIGTIYLLIVSQIHYQIPYKIKAVSLCLIYTLCATMIIYLINFTEVLQILISFILLLLLILLGPILKIVQFSQLKHIFSNQYTKI